MKIALGNASKIPLHSTTKENHDAFYKELTEASDRASVLVATSALDQILVEILASAFVNMDFETEAESQFFGRNANFGTFSIRTDLCYYLGLLEKQEKDDLDTLRIIRNAFAHSTEPLSLYHPSVKAEIDKLGVTVANYPGHYRGMFVAASMSLYTKLHNRSLGLIFCNREPRQNLIQQAHDAYAEALKSLRETPAQPHPVPAPNPDHTDKTPSDPPEASPA